MKIKGIVKLCHLVIIYVQGLLNTYTSCLKYVCLLKTKLNGFKAFNIVTVFSLLNFVALWYQKNWTLIEFIESVGKTWLVSAENKFIYLQLYSSFSLTFYIIKMQPKKYKQIFTLNNLSICLTEIFLLTPLFYYNLFLVDNLWIYHRNIWKTCTYGYMLVFHCR